MARSNSRSGIAAIRDSISWALVAFLCACESGGGANALDAALAADLVARPPAHDAYERIQETGPRRDAALRPDPVSPDDEAGVADALRPLGDAPSTGDRGAQSTDSGLDAARADAAPAPDAAVADAGLAPDAAPPVDLTQDAIVRQCALQAGCLPAELGGGGLGVCTNHFRGVAEELSRGSTTTAWRSVEVFLTCMAEAADCATYGRCRFRDDPRVETCDGQVDPVDSCDGDFRINCAASGVHTGEDCAAAGLVCGQVDGRAQCGLTPCEPGTPETCDGHAQVRCGRNVIVRTDCLHSLWQYCFGLGGPDEVCESFGRPTCGLDPDPDAQGEVTCVSDGPPCGVDLQPHCEGDTYVTCDEGHTSTTDCAGVGGEGWGCGEGISLFGGRVYGCVPLLADCATGEPEACDGRTIRFCSAGRRATFDCGSVGLSTCFTEEDDFTGGVVARCAE